MSDAQILDRGYRKFAGERSGVGGAVRSVMWHTIRSILGLGRSARHKVFPVIVLFVAFVPAIAFLALAVLIGDLLEGELRPDYWEFFGFAFVATVVFVALVAPEAIVRDRRNGMFSLYLSTPLTRWTYLSAKVAAVLATMSLVVLAPPLLWLLGYTFQSQGPDGVVDWFGVLGGLLLAGLAICTLNTAVSLGVSSLTDRRAFASIAVVFVLFGPSIATSVLVEVADLDEIWRLFDPLTVAFEMAPRIFGDRSDQLASVGTVPIVAAYLAWTLAGGALLVGRYRRLEAV